MKTRILINILCILAIGCGLTSCLEGDEMNTPPGGSPPIVEMSYVAKGGTLFNSGLEPRFFAAQALLLSPADETDTVSFAVTVQGGGGVSQDVNISLHLDPDAVLDNVANDKVQYAMMPTDQYKILTMAGTIPQGESFVEFKIVFFPNKMDFTKSTMLPIFATNDAELLTSSNYGKLYLHVIGNPIAGLYTREFIRFGVPDPAPGDTPDIHNEATVVLAPVDPTTVNTPTGYYDGLTNYIITFDDDGAGNLTNFKAVLDPVWLNDIWTPAGISLVTGPTITASPDYKTFTIKYTTGTRNVTDIYTRQ